MINCGSDGKPGVDQEGLSWITMVGLEQDSQLCKGR